MASSKTSLILFLCVVAAFAAAGTIYWTSQLTADESQQRETLKQFSVLTTMAGDGRCLGAVNFTTIKDKDDFHNAFETVLSLQRISSLNLNGMPIEAADLQKLGRLSSLASLSLTGCTIDEQGLKSIAELTNLETLHLSNTPTSDQGLASLAKLEKLTSIDLSETAVRRDLSALTLLPRLKWLLLAKCALEEGALTSLQSAPALTRVTLSESEYDAEEAQALKVAIPGLAIDE